MYIFLRRPPHPPPSLGMFKEYHIIGFPETWEKGISALIFKSGARNNLYNYRHITLMQAIYEIWAAIIANRISPITNILTKDNQCAYKEKKYQPLMQSYIKRNFIKNKITGLVSLDLSKSFGRIDRGKLRWVIYEKVMPIELTDMLIK